MKKRHIKHGFTKALFSFIGIAIVVVAVSSYFVFNRALVGPAFLVMGLILLASLKKVFRINIKSIYPDIGFGIIDNVVLVFTAGLGALYAGVFGAIVGGATGDTIADGLGGIFEGQIAENQRKYKINNARTPLSTMLGKVVGCLLGAGIALMIIWFIGILKPA